MYMFFEKNRISAPKGLAKIAQGIALGTDDTRRASPERARLALVFR